MVDEIREYRNKNRAHIWCLRRVTSTSDFQQYVTERDTMSVPIATILKEVHQKLDKQAKELMPIEGAAYKRREYQESPELSGAVEPMSMYSKYFSKKPDMKSTFNDIIASVHSTMKSVNFPQRAPTTTRVPKTTKTITEPLENKSSENRSRSGSMSRSKTRIHRHRIAGGQNHLKVPLSIPMTKADIDRHLQIAMRRGITSSMLNDKNYAYQRRIREVMQQKSVLETMLMEHRKLQRDRLNIAMDIQKMRNDLDKIRQKLDISLQSLKCTQTFASRLTGRGNAPKNTTRSDSLTSKPKLTRTSVVGTKSKKPLFRSGSITKKRSLVPRHSTRRLVKS